MSLLRGKNIIVILTLIISTVGISNALTIISSISPNIPSEYNPPGGLTWDGSYLWISVTPARSGGPPTGKIYKVSPIDGSIITALDSPGSAPYGIAWDGSYLWNVDRSSKFIYKIDPISGVVLFSIQIPDLTGEPLGLAYGDGYLWLIEWYWTWPYRVFKINPQTGDMISSFPAPDRNWGIAWDGISLWSSNPRLDLIYRMSPQTGSVLASYSYPGAYPTGLAWDGAYLWCADYQARRIYKLDVRAAPIPEPSTFIFIGIGLLGIKLMRRKKLRR